MFCLDCVSGNKGCAPGFAGVRALRHAQPYYRNSIRSGFVAFRDEDDEETLQRIAEQCQRDAQWVLQKASRVVGRMCVACGGAHPTWRGGAANSPSWRMIDPKLGRTLLQYKAQSGKGGK